MLREICSLLMLLTCVNATCRPAHEPITLPVGGPPGGRPLPGGQPASAPASGVGGCALPAPQPPTRSVNATRAPTFRHMIRRPPSVGKMIILPGVAGGVAGERA